MKLTTLQLKRKLVSEGRLKYIEKDLSKNKAYGYTEKLKRNQPATIVINSRIPRNMPGNKRMALTHELIHFARPSWSESKIRKATFKTKSFMIKGNRITPVGRF